MAIKKASRPSASAAPSKSAAKATGKTASKGKVSEEEIETVTGVGPWGEIGTTASRTVRSGGEDVFVSVTAKYPFDASVDGADEEAYEKAVNFVDLKLTERLEGIPDDAANSEGEADDEKPAKKSGKKSAKKPEPEEDEEDEDAEDDEESEDDEEADDDEEGDLTEEDIRGMDKKALIGLIDEQELDVDKKLSLAKLRDAVIEALSEEGEDDEDEDEDDADEDEDEESEDEDGEEDEDADEEDDEPYTKEQLEELKLADLIKIADAWELEVDVKKGAELPAKKKAYIKAILKDQEEQQAE